MYAKAALLAISALILDAHATSEERPAWTWEDVEDTDLAEWDKAEWNKTEWLKGEWNKTQWNITEWGSRAERGAERENRSRAGCQNRTGRDRRGREDRDGHGRWDKDEEHEDEDEEHEDNDEEHEDEDEEELEDAEDAEAEDRFPERGVFQEEPAEQPGSVSGEMALTVTNATGFAALPEAEGVVRGVLADLASIEEESIVDLSLTAVAGNGSRRLTAVNDAVNVRYVISGVIDSRESLRIAATLRNVSDGEVARVCDAHIRAAGLPYSVNGARITSVSFAPSRENAPKEDPCVESEEGESQLRGSRRRGNCGPPPLSSGHHDKEGIEFGLLVGISLASALAFALCVGIIACICRRRRTKPQGPKVVVIEGPPCTGSPAKATEPAQGTVVDNNNNDNNNNNDIVMGYVVPEPHKDGGLVV